MWPYTFYLTELWGQDRDFFFMPGYFLSAFGGLLISAFSLLFVRTKSFRNLGERVIDEPTKWDVRKET